MFKNFSELNAALSSVDSSKTYFLDQMENLISMIRSGAALGQQTNEAYARAYAQVQQTKYDAEGNITDVTSADRLSVPNAVLAKDKARGASWLGEFENAKSSLIRPTLNVDIQTGTINQTATVYGTTLTWSLDLATFDSSLSVGGNLQLPESTMESLGRFIANFQVGSRVLTPGNYLSAGKFTAILGPIGTAYGIPVIENGKMIALFFGLSDSLGKVAEYFKTSTDITQISHYGPCILTDTSKPGGYSNQVIRITETKFPIQSNPTSLVGSESKDKIYHLYADTLPPKSCFYVNANGPLKVGSTSGSGVYVEANPDWNATLPATELKVQATVQADSQSVNLAGVITANAPDYIPVAEALMNLTN